MKDWLSFITPLGHIVGGIVFIWMFRKQGGLQAITTSNANWRQLAESETAKNSRLESENGKLRETITLVQEDLKECEKLRNEIGRHNLRLEAREEKYQACINRLEKLNGLPLTVFDDPTFYTSQSMDAQRERK